MNPRRRAERRPSTPLIQYRGAAGLGDKFYLAELDDLNRVVRRASPIYSYLDLAIIAWARRHDRSLRLVREIVVREIVA